MIALQKSFLESFNRYYILQKPFLFVINFDGSMSEVVPLDKINAKEILYSFQADNQSLTNAEKSEIQKINYTPSFVCYKRYTAACRYIMNEQYKGNSYLANLTFPSLFDTGSSLVDIFFASNAKYKMYYRDRFTVFSPEQFVTIDNGIISTSPMKGTIRADIHGAADVLMHDPKEQAEHVTVVDLLRNDLSLVCDDVYVEKYRYLERINSNGRDLFQTSSRISGRLQEHYRENPADIFTKILPAGSVTGAPKKRTVEIIKNAEGYNRGYYTGVFGYFDGTVLDSAVMIRFIEKYNGKLYYKSGGGITIYSSPGDEYQEMKDKVYVPVC